MLRNRNPIDLVEVRPSTMSVRHVVQQTQQTLQFAVREKDYPCDQIVIKAEASEYATCNTQKPGATEEHQPPSHSTCSMTLRNNFVNNNFVIALSMVYLKNALMCTYKKRKKSQIN